MNTISTLKTVGSSETQHSEVRSFTERPMVLTIVGVGLISGSFALALREKGFATKVIGVSRTEASIKKAGELGIIDEALPLEEAVAKSDFIYVAIP